MELHAILCPGQIKKEAVTHWIKAGLIYNESEHWSRAEISLAYAIENGADDADTLRAIGLAQVKTGHILQAKITIKKLLENDATDRVAIENGADDAETLRAIGLAQVKTDHVLQAKITIEKLLEKNPNDAVALELQSMLPQE